MQIVVPMAGAGRRFAAAGYGVPKPLIPVGEMPMVVQVVKDLPLATRLIFVCHPDHVADHGIDTILRGYFPGCRVVVTPGLTDGQACSVRLAAPHLDLDAPVLIAACDNSHLYDRRRLTRLLADPKVDAVIWTYRRDARVLVRPDRYSWVKARADGTVLDVCVKKPLSSMPLHDLVMSGCFWFRSAATMLEGIDRLVAADQRVNGEFYLDSVANMLLTQGCRLLAFEVDKFIGWGTPDDLEDFQRWYRYITASTRAA